VYHMTFGMFLHQFKNKTHLHSPIIGRFIDIANIELYNGRDFVFNIQYMLEKSVRFLLFLRPLSTTHAAKEDVYRCLSRLYLSLLMLFYELTSTMRTYLSHN
jgi:hypothetical protein